MEPRIPRIEWADAPRCRPADATHTAMVFSYAGNHYVYLDVSRDAAQAKFESAINHLPPEMRRNAGNVAMATERYFSDELILWDISRPKSRIAHLAAIVGLARADDPAPAPIHF